MIDSVDTFYASIPALSAFCSFVVVQSKSLDCFVIRKSRKYYYYDRRIDEKAIVTQIINSVHVTPYGLCHFSYAPISNIRTV